MKLWLTIAFALVFFSGCNSGKYNTMLRNKNAKQMLLIQKQQAQIATLQQQLKKRRHASKKKKLARIPQAPKRNIKLKKVEDNNYSSGYMYPGAKKKKKTPMVEVAAVSTNVATTNTPNTSTTMNKASCIAMIGQAKFDKYTQMFGGEAGSIKRCKMLKAMR